MWSIDKQASDQLRERIVKEVVSCNITIILKQVKQHLNTNERTNSKNYSDHFQIEAGIDPRHQINLSHRIAAAKPCTNHKEK